MLALNRFVAYVAVMRGYVLVLIGTAFFATSLPFSAWAVSGFDPFTAGVGRAFLGGLLSLITLLVVRPTLPQGRQWRHLGFAAVGTGLIFPLFTNLGMASVGPNDGAVVIAILPLSTAIFARFIEPDRRLGPWFWAGSGLACLVVLAFVLRDGFGGLAPGHMALVLSLFVGFSYAWAGRTARDLPAWQVICWASVLALPGQVLAFALFWPWLDLDAGVQAWVGLSLGALGAQWAGFFFFYAGLALVGSARGSLMQYSQPFMTFFLVAALAWSIPDWRVFPYALAVIAGLALTRLDQGAQSTK